MSRILFGAVALLLSLGIASVGRGQESRFQFQPDQHICIVGNTLAERMQHDAWLESMLHARLPEHRLVIRNLGYSADTLKTRLRSAGFGSPDEHLNRNKADVIFMMFGFGESFAGEAGLEQFKADYTAEIKRMQQQKYNGKSAPQLILVSPVAHENLKRLNFPDGSENNVRLDLYTQAIRDVAAANNLPFVDLFHFTQASYPMAVQPWTINGVHLNEFGNQQVARQIVDTLLGPKSLDAGKLEKIRTAVQDKNFYWFNLYRTTDGFSIFGGRADLEFVNRQTNRDVMQRELEVLQEMTDFRDPKIWAVAQGKEYSVDDSKTRPFIDVISNKKGENPDGTHKFLGGKEAISKMKVLDGFEVRLFASEEKFPELANPVQMAFDTKGRLWVAVWPSYPHWKPKDEMNDKLLIFEDTNGDGEADVCKTFASGLHNPTGFEFWNGGVYVAQVPDLLFLQDTDGDDKADKMERVLHGIDSADTHHSINSFTVGPDGGLYFQEGTFHHTQVESPFGIARSANAGSFRFEPRTGKFDLYTAVGYANPHGHVFDLYGTDILHDGTGSNPYDAALISGRIDYPNKHRPAPQVYGQRTRPCPATEFVSGGHFPDEMAGELLVENVIGDLGILRYKIEEQGSSISGSEQPPLLLSSDPNFRPVDLEFAPDGTLYLVDWQNPIIGHMQHNLRDPSRDHVHGRIYQVRNKTNPPLEVEPEFGQPTAKLVDDLLKANLRTRYRIRIELSNRSSDEVLAAAVAAGKDLRADNPLDCLKLLELLWLHEQHHVVNKELLLTTLTCRDHRVRGAAVRTLTNWIDELPEAADLLLASANDSHPRVRMLAVRGASYLPGSNGLPIVAAAAGQEIDRYLDYVIGETMRQVDPGWKSFVGEMKWLSDVNRRSRAFVLDRLSPAELSTIPMTEEVAEYLMTRSGIDENLRKSAVERVAVEREIPASRVIVSLLSELESRSADRTVMFDLIRLLGTQPRAELALERQRLASFAESSALPALRQTGLVGMLMADQGIDGTWEFASKSPERLLDLAQALPMLPDLDLQLALYPRVLPLLDGLPEALKQNDANAKKGGLAKFIRIELPGDSRILTLAEVEVLSGGNNLAREGNAKQSSTGHSGDAVRAIDGNTEGGFQSGGQTHTAESTKDPWWEVELPTPSDIDSVRVFNRTDANLGKRLDGFTLKILDEDRKPLFLQAEVAAPAEMLDIPVEVASQEQKLKRVAIQSLAKVGGKEGEVFGKLASMIADGNESDTAARAIQGLPPAVWKADVAAKLVPVIVRRIEETPVPMRTSDTIADWMQLGEAVAGLLPPEEGSKLRKQLGSLGIRVIRLGVKPHRMAYDKTKLVVEPNKPLVIVFENTDMMPHNWVLTEPGAMEAIGMQAEEDAQKPEAMAQNYVPQNSRVLASSRLVQPQQSQRLNLTTPTKPGIYPFVCTYPGHWRRMYGALYVVENPEAFQANPAEYLAQNQLAIKDELLLTINRAATEWKLGDLSKDLEAEFTNGRDFVNGQQLFTIGSCVSCHKFAGKGYEVGSDLTKLDPQWTPEDVLNHIIEPSMKIDEKYKTQIFQLVSGNTVSGVVVAEDNNSVRIVENPLVQSSTTTIAKSDIDERRASTVSIMPKGLLDTLTKDEIFDLLGYIIAGGDEQHPLYTGKR
jgi:putative heme-binding domain-containing protein